MSKRKIPPVKEDISPNLIPMIDIMFLLLLFFMLGADMSQREMAEVVLPTADKAKEDKGENDVNAPQTTINISHDPDVACPINDNAGTCREDGHWVWGISGLNYDKTTIGPHLQILANADLEPDVDPQAGKQLSKRKVMIRADKAAPYGDIQKVIEISGQAGIYKVEIGAARPTSAP